MCSPGLIKHGCNSGSITIILSNTGINAHKPAEYGDEIHIVRTINSGSSSYKILNKWGTFFGYFPSIFVEIMALSFHSNRLKLLLASISILHAYLRILIFNRTFIPKQIRRISVHCP